MALTVEQQAIETMSRAKHLLIVIRSAQSVDHLCAALALGLWLDRWKKTYDIVVPDFQTNQYPSYLPQTVTISTKLGTLRTFRMLLDVEKTPLSELSYDVQDGKLAITAVPKHGAWKPEDVSFLTGETRYDAIVSIGAPDRHSLLPIFERESAILHDLVTINIDSSPANEQWGTINLVNPTRSSSCESLFTLLEAWNPQQMDADISTALLAGMIAATKGFRTPHLSGKTLERSSTLLERGARRQQIVQQLWRTKSVQSLQTWGKALARLEQDPATTLAWTFITETDLIELKADSRALDGLLTDLLSYTPQTKAIVLFQQRGNVWQVEMSAQAPYSAIELAKPFLPTGNQEFARFVTDPAKGNLTEQKEQVLSLLKDALVTS